MTISLKIPKNIVSVDWLHQNLSNKKLIILDATLPKVTSEKEIQINENQIIGAIFFDIKNIFSEAEAEFPNTVVSPEKFEKEAQKLGINSNSIIVVYDDLGIYSSPRVWWMFQLMGFKNVVVLDGGFPEWKKNKYPIEKKKDNLTEAGNFKVIYQRSKIVFKENVLENIDSKERILLDARSKSRFFSEVAEPRKGVRSGSVSNSKNLPYATILDNGKLKPIEELKTIYNSFSPEKKEFIFSCGTGITACILALGAEVAEIKNYTVYDGSWTEWGSTLTLPIEN